ncbi:hypothetical protein DPMN_050794 [Dreissena polymorpha]|uniref:Uncharacterized protein n=1 Tax=Dreissena polymorpha TaxID=45954 RepID=A0A9D4CHG2_DREPO|nr:hypothetical protein DPMN_050794 [Dreissena polymorpha]
MCQKCMRENPSPKITKFNVAALASNPYVKVLSNSNLTVSFQKACIYPLDRTAVPVDNFKPSAQYVGLDPIPVSAADKSDVDSYFKATESVIDKKKEHDKTAINKTLVVFPGKKLPDQTYVRKFSAEHSPSLYVNQQHTRRAKTTPT